VDRTATTEGTQTTEEAGGVIMGWGNPPKKTKGILPSTKIKNDKAERNSKNGAAHASKVAKGKNW
jgi:hypothetical protein